MQMQTNHTAVANNHHKSTGYIQGGLNVQTSRTLFEKRKRLTRKIRKTFDQSIDILHKHKDAQDDIVEIQQLLKERTSDATPLFNMALFAIPFAIFIEILLLSPTAEYLATLTMPEVGVDRMDAFLEIAWPMAGRFLIPLIIVMGELVFAHKKNTAIQEVKARLKVQGLEDLEEKSDWNEVRTWRLMSAGFLLVATCLTIALYTVGKEFSTLPDILILVGMAFLATTGHFVILFGGPQVYESWIHLFTRKSRRGLKRSLRKTKKRQRHLHYDYRIKYQQLKDCLAIFLLDFPDDLPPIDIEHLPMALNTQSIT